MFPPAFILARAARESRLGSLSGGSSRGRRRSSRSSQVLRTRVNGPISINRHGPFSRQLDLIPVVALAHDFAFHPAAVCQHLHVVVEIPLSGGVVGFGQFSLPPHFDGPAFRNLNSVFQADKVRIAPDLKDLGVLPARGQYANAVADFETAAPGRSGCCVLSVGRGWGLRWGSSRAARRRSTTSERRRRRRNLAPVRI